MQTPRGEEWNMPGGFCATKKFNSLCHFKIEIHDESVEKLICSNDCAGAWVTAPSNTAKSIVQISTLDLDFRHMFRITTARYEL